MCAINFLACSARLGKTAPTSTFSAAVVLLFLATIFVPFNVSDASE